MQAVHAGPVALTPDSDRRLAASYDLASSALLQLPDVFDLFVLHENEGACLWRPNIHLLVIVLLEVLLQLEQICIVLRRELRLDILMLALQLLVICLLSYGLRERGVVRRVHLLSLVLSELVMFLNLSSCLGLRVDQLGRMCVCNMKSHDWLVVPAAHHLHVRRLVLGDLPVVVHALFHGVALLLLFKELVLLQVVQLDVVRFEVVSTRSRITRIRR